MQSFHFILLSDVTGFNLYLISFNYLTLSTIHYNIKTTDKMMSAFGNYTLSQVQLLNIM